MTSLLHDDHALLVHVLACKWSCSRKARSFVSCLQVQQTVAEHQLYCAMMEVKSSTSELATQLGVARAENALLHASHVH